MGTRKQVADAAGVSLRTVSNVVNGFAHVSEATRLRVLQAVADLDYRPSEIARTLKRGRSGLIALVLPGFDTPYFAELTHAFVHEGAARGFTVVIDQTDGDIERERLFLDRTDFGSLFDALIISPLALVPADLDSVSTDRAVVILGENAFPRFDQVMIDNVAAARAAVAHLAGAGRKRIAAIGAESRPLASSSQRLIGYRQGLADVGIAVDESLIEFVDSFHRRSGAEAMARLLDRPDPPDAVFCFSDPLALGAIRALHTRGIRVPEDVAIVGFDDIEDGAFATPSLTTISPDKSFIAAAALDLVAEKLDRTVARPSQLTIAPHALVVRESSGGARS